ncbi:MAG: RIO1 family regulatory kinase/ATPase [Lentisphaeria bacterium]
MNDDSMRENISNTNRLPDCLDQWPPFAEIRKTGRILRKATSWGNSDTYILQTKNNTEYLLKTFSRKPLLIRKILGRISIRHEYNLLKHLEKHGFRYAPKAYRMPNEDSLVMEFIVEGIQLQKKEKYAAATHPAPAFFQQLISLMRELHAMGICHGDFRRANILRLPDESPVLIDWATAMIKSPNEKKISLFRPLFNAMRRSDLYSLASITESYYPDLLDAELRQYLIDQPWYLRLGRFLRQKVYRQFLKPLAGKKNHPKED